MPVVKERDEPGKHHFLPKFWLSGFTDTGEKNGHLWVTDFSRQRQWRSSPAKVGYIEDFYRLSDQQPDPLAVETALAKIETAVAPILRGVDRELRPPTRDELDVLLDFMAIQWARVPGFRPFTLKIMKSACRSQLTKGLQSPEAWAALLKRAGISGEDSDAVYKDMREIEQSKDWPTTPGTGWYIQKAFRAAEKIGPLLRARHWGTAFSPSGSFIASDTPVIIEGPKGEMVGFRNAEIITYPLSRHVYLYGTYGPKGQHRTNRKEISRLNTLTMLMAGSQVYSRVSDFSWMDETGKHQEYWQLFSRDKY
jgi:Protein of unknown function (DUF4238)